MRAAERVLVLATGILIVAVIVLCWGIATALQVDYGTGSGSGFGRPWPIIWVQIASTVAPVFALVGLASTAGLLFLRAARWTGTPAAEE